MSTILRANVTEDDTKECIEIIIEDNKFDRTAFLKECGVNHLTKNFKIDHLVAICRHKGYGLKITLPEDRMEISYYLENNDVEKKSNSIDELDLPEEFSKDEDEDDLDFI